MRSNDRLAGLALARHRAAGRPCRRRTRRGAGSVKPQLAAASLREKLVRNLHQDAGAVAGQRIASAGAAMGQVVEHLEALLHDVVRALALDVDDEADAARVVLVRGIVETLRVAECCGS